MPAPVPRFSLLQSQIARKGESSSGEMYCCHRQRRSSSTRLPRSRPGRHYWPGSVRIRGPRSPSTALPARGALGCRLPRGSLDVLPLGRESAARADDADVRSGPCALRSGCRPPSRHCPARPPAPRATFHGYDITMAAVRATTEYGRLFRTAARIVAVSEFIRSELSELERRPKRSS